MVRRIGFFLFVVLIVGFVGAYWAYRQISGPNVEIQGSPSKIVYIPLGSDFDQVVYILDTAQILSDMASFKRVSSWMKYNQSSIKSGRYLIEDQWSNRQLVSLLRTGAQSPVQFVLNSCRTINDVAGEAAKKIEPDSIEFLQTFLSSENLAKTKLDTQSILSLFVPNTYELYWTTNTQEFFDRMKNEHESFWNKDNRKAKAAILEFQPAEVYTLASIVEKETLNKEERPIVAGLYLNRLKKNIPLQADPTIVFAVQDFTLRRVLNKHLQFESPYNTYLNTGLPPGPICMPSISSIDAVLNPRKHHYLYMCARPDNSGLHNFAATIAEHGKNARIYRNWLDQRGIR